jgi:hypothetical protein
MVHVVHLMACEVMKVVSAMDDVKQGRWEEISASKLIEINSTFGDAIITGK